METTVGGHISDWYEQEERWNKAVRPPTPHVSKRVFFSAVVLEEEISAFGSARYMSQYLEDYARHADFEGSTELLLPTTWTETEIDEQEFHELVDEWRAGTRLTSSLTDVVLHPAYQTIIGLGPGAVPLILRELQDRPAPWFWALSYITRADPVKPEDAGRLKKMTEAWLEWGRQRDLI
ncbi:MAG: hypothetical protein LC781_08565 [Actinobacteria bacterium]|nr:hypothetical protein [Actinomycetota bacterium]